MALHQINVGHVPEQDRLLVRISTTDRLEYRFWITRHLLKGLWHGLLQRMQASEPVRQQAAPEARAAMLGFEHEKAVGEAQFGDDYQREGLKPALPGDPMLVTAVTLGSGKDVDHVLVFRPRAGAAVTLQVKDRMLHAFARLLQDAAATAGWDLALPLPGTAPAPSPRLVN